jgi:hypothetical protein
MLGHGCQRISREVFRRERNGDRTAASQQVVDIVLDNPGDRGASLTRVPSQRLQLALAKLDIQLSHALPPATTIVYQRIPQYTRVYLEAERPERPD